MSDAIGPGERSSTSWSRHHSALRALLKGVRVADKDNDPAMRALYILAGAIGVVWIASLVVDMINPSYDPPANLGLVFMSVVSALLGVITAAKTRSSRNDDEDDKGGKS